MVGDRPKMVLRTAQEFVDWLPWYVKGGALAVILIILLTETPLQNYPGYVTVFLIGFALSFGWQSRARIVDLNEHRQTVIHLMLLTSVLQGFIETADKHGILEEASQNAQDHHDRTVEMIEDIKGGMDPIDVEAKYADHLASEEAITFDFDDDEAEYDFK